MSADNNLPYSQDPVHKLYANHHGWLKTWLRNRVSCPELAADLAQDTFLKLLPKPAGLSDVKNPQSYLRTIASRLCIDMWRRKSVEQAWLETLAEQPEILAISPQEHAIIVETICEIDDMLRRLPVKAATAFVLSQVDGLTYKQIATQLEVSERMVKKYLAQAMLECMLIEARFDEQCHTE